MKRRNKQTNKHEGYLRIEQENFVSCLISRGKFKDAQQPATLPRLTTVLFTHFLVDWMQTSKQLDEKVISTGGYQN